MLFTASLQSCASAVLPGVSDPHLLVDLLLRYLYSALNVSSSQPSSACSIINASLHRDSKQQQQQQQQA
jgi:hypothetical protein